MSDTWKVDLVFTDERSNKFWRGRVEGSDTVVNYGRVGTNGQTQTKSFGSPEEAAAALDKQAAGKRRKGYADHGGSGDSAPAEAPAPALPTAADSVTMTLDSDGRDIELSLHYDGKVVRTEVAETYRNAEEAAAAFVRIQRALGDDGYRAKS